MPEYRIINEIEKTSKYYDLVNHEGCFTDSEFNLIVDGLREGYIFLKYTGETAFYFLEKIPEVINYLKARYSYIIIDEYQDCGEIQDAVFRKLVECGLIGMAVGDVNQAIFGFAKRFPDYLISLIRRNDFTHFELNKNHRCHSSISEYSLCLFNASKTIPNEKRVFKVCIEGAEESIAYSIDSNIDKIKQKYKVTNNNQIAILCRNNSTITRIYKSIKTSCKVFEDTPLDKDETDWGRFFSNLLSSIFNGDVYFVDYVEQLFSEEYEPKKYHKALLLCESIFSCNFCNLANFEEKIISLAELVHPGKYNESSVSNLKTVITNKKMLESYIPARENEINLMTLHKSKGLEFSIVFHLDMYEWIIPNKYNEKDQTQDLNLHYVGVTRAKDVCYIMIGTKRYRSKYDDYISAEPSSFLSLPGLAERRFDVKWYK